MKLPSHRIVGARLDEAMERAGYKGHGKDVKLGEAIGVWSNQVARWRKGTSTPQGDTLTKLCTVLGVSSNWLFGETETAAAERARVLADVERVFGRTARTAVENLGKLTPHHAVVVAARVEGWVARLEDEERKHPTDPSLPPTPFDIDEARAVLEVQDNDDVKQPAGPVAVAAR